MLKSSSNFKKFFLLAFTRELIEKASGIEIYSIEEIFQKKRKLVKKQKRSPVRTVIKQKKPLSKIIPSIKKPLEKEKTQEITPSIKPYEKQEEAFAKSILSDARFKEFPFALGIEREVKKKPIIPIKRRIIGPKPIHPNQLPATIGPIKPVQEIKGPIKKIRVPLSTIEKSGGLEKFTVSTDRFPGLTPPIPEFKGVIPNPKPVSIDLGKLNPLLQDNNVKEIICKGDGQNIIVRGNFGTRRTAISLKKEEIEDVINKFSQMTKIPVTEGIYKVIYGNLFLTAVVSRAVSTTFEIKKIPSAPLPPPLKRIK